MPSVIYKAFPVTEIGESGGDVTVLGKCSDGAVDSDGDIVSPAFMAQAIKTWMRVCPSVYREHSPGHPAGMGIDAWQDDTGATWVTSRISDSESAALCRSGRLTSYSVGIHDPVTRKSVRCPRDEIVGGRLTEVSIVGTPANLRCGVRIIGKSASGVPEFIGKAFGMSKGKKSRIIEEHYDELARLALPCGCQQCQAAARSVRKAAKMAADPARTAEKALRSQMRASLESSNPFFREMARAVLRGED